MAAQTLEGEYRLTGVQDAASAFRFTPDGQFDFFFIYGAVDRIAKGTYTVQGDTIKLTSDKEPGKDFPISKASQHGKNYTIKVSDPNPYLCTNILAIYYTGEKKEAVYSDEKGIINIDIPSVDTIYLLHELFPDIPSLIKDVDNPNNYFEVTLSPTLSNVSFKGIDFMIDGSTISCLPNYVLPFGNIKYVKE